MGFILVLNACKEINRFYRSQAWKEARLNKILLANGRCERCGAVGEEVHHLIHLTPQNIGDSEVTLNPKNLILLCKECHNKEHKRFKNKKIQFDKEGNVRL